MAPLQHSARFDTRLPEAQKQFFERAAVLGGYRNLSEFVLRTVQEKAKQIIAQNEQIIASKRDSEIFFDALANPQKPNTALRTAVQDYKTRMVK